MWRGMRTIDVLRGCGVGDIDRGFDRGRPAGDWHHDLVAVRVVVLLIFMELLSWRVNGGVCVRL